jgi:hypothetical protein
VELVDRYLKTVKQFLPQSQQEDIVHELSDDMHSQIENKEAEVGRPLAETELARILEQYGHPYMLAGKYQAHDRSFSFGRQIIGPTLFPLYVKVLAINLTISLLVVFGIVTVQSLAGHSVNMTSFMWLGSHLLLQFSIVTVIFSGVQWKLKRSASHWNPLHPERLYEPSPESANRVSRFESIAQLISLIALLVGIESVARSSSITADLREVGLKLGPVWQHVHIVLLGLIGIGILQGIANLIRPDWIGLNRAVRVAGGIIWVGLTVYLLVAGNWIMPISETSLASEKLRVGLDTFNRWFFWSVLVTVLVSATTIGADTYRVIWRARGRSAR